MKQSLQSTTTSDTVDLLYFVAYILFFTGALATFIADDSAMSALTLTNDECEDRHGSKAEEIVDCALTPSRAK